MGTGSCVLMGNPFISWCFENLIAEWPGLVQHTHITNKPHENLTSCALCKCTHNTHIAVVRLQIELDLRISYICCSARCAHWIYSQKKKKKKFLWLLYCHWTQYNYDLTKIIYNTDARVLRCVVLYKYKYENVHICDGEWLVRSGPVRLVVFLL